MSLRRLTQVPVKAPPNGLQGACSLDSATFNVFKVSKRYEFNTLKGGRSALHPGDRHRRNGIPLVHERAEKAKQPLLGKKCMTDSPLGAAGS
ncbi:hypothetical protein [Variovorax sp. PvP013]|uniref:hypothetical protein n=1 Tax=Variovorax sp. PvP013 TaxID=3156435 RepID=UPI003D1F5B24